MSNAQTIAQKNSLLRRLISEQDDKMLAKKELIKEQSAETVFMDRVSEKGYRMIPATLTSGVDFDLSDTTGSSTEEQIFSYTVPNGIEYLFSQPVGRMGDWYSPRIYGDIYDGATTAALINSGVMRIRIYDAGGDYVKGTALVVGLREFNEAEASDLNKRCYFNAPNTLRAREGDEIRGTVTAATAMEADNSTVTMVLVKLTKVAG